MTNTHNRQLERRRTHRRSVFLGTIAAVAIVGASGLAIIRIASGGASDTSATATGETSTMGMPIMATPGRAIGTATTDGTMASPATWALGQVPLNITVRPSWTLTNTGNDTIILGDTHVQINQGCCPGALTYEGSSTLTPGAETRLTFELSMHPGMDGVHDMTLHVPIAHADGSTDTLDLTVTGDFRD